ncbi:Uncharacterised protein [Candidatus Bilamarchaeum dharawalense]|uniref:Uncharacterized protein n=1 Tax=Candidatus Bilamarchaeum dharawalense TaxID=2885759 RepID=A0A5E4LKS3_9ARCH|nr:Uncharacterised protein [Candidatus Bilamarchaeum dharawalense]
MNKKKSSKAHTQSEISESEEPEPVSPVPTKKDNTILKWGAVIILLAIALFFVNFYLNPNQQFVFGKNITEDEFKDVFASAQKVYIVMDVRNSGDQTTTNNVLQCGVDFAASSGMGGKDVTPLSFADDGCIVPSGKKTMAECLPMINDGVVVYVRGGSDPAKYYSNAVLVSVGQQYAVGLCGIRLVQSSSSVPKEGANATETS